MSGPVPTLLADDLWTVEDDLPLMGGLIHFPLRMTVVRLVGGELVLWSPVPIGDHLQAALEALGPVRHVVAPNGFHHLYAKAASERFPKATLWLSPALERKRPDLWAIGQPLVSAGLDLGHGLQMLLIEGMPALGEVVGFHVASRTLIVTDLLFNMHQTRGVLTPWMLRLTGAYRTFAQSRLLRSQIKDRAAVRSAYAKVLAWPIERVVMAHGDLICEDAHRTTADALSWLDSSLAAC